MADEISSCLFILTQITSKLDSSLEKFFQLCWLRQRFTLMMLFVFELMAFGAVVVRRVSYSTCIISPKGVIDMTKHCLCYNYCDNSKNEFIIMAKRYHGKHAKSKKGVSSTTWLLVKLSPILPLFEVKCMRNVKKTLCLPLNI